MADDKTNLEVAIKSTFDGKGTADAAVGIRKVGESAKETSTSVADLKKSFTELIAAAAVISFLKEATEGALDMEKALRLVDQTAVKMGLGVEETRKKVQDFASELSALAGVEDDEIVKAVGRSFAATNDLAQAMARAAMAADLATKYSIDYGEAMNVVEDAARGKTKGLDALTKTTTTGTDATEKAANAMLYLEKNVKGATSATNDHVIQVARLQAQWKNVKDTIGEAVIPAIEWLQDAFFSVGNGVGLVAAKTMNLMTTTAEGFGSLGDAMKKMLAGDFKEGWASFTKTMAETDKKLTDLNNLAEDDAEKRDRAYFEGKKKRIQDIVTEQLKANKTIENDGPKKDKKADTEVYDNEKQRQDQLLKSEAARLKAAIQERKEFEAAKITLAKWGAKETSRIEESIDDERERLMDAQTKRIRDQVMLKKAAAEYEKEMNLEVANSSLALMGQLFGDSKELAVAQAIINTYEGATKALAQGGIYGPILAAIVIASGLASVAKITSTGDSTKGSGFDDPGNDAAARIGGRRWAADMIGEFSAGASQGWAQGMRAGGNQTTTNDNRRTFNVHMHGAGFIDPTNINSMKQFHRALQVIDKQYAGQRTVARAR